MITCLHNAPSRRSREIVGGYSPNDLSDAFNPLANAVRTGNLKDKSVASLVSAFKLNTQGNGVTIGIEQVAREVFAPAILEKDCLQ